VDSAPFDLGKKGIHFAIAHQGIAAHEGDVERLVFIDQGKNAGDEIVATEVREISEP
jgi:hypothetical protein